MEPAQAPIIDQYPIANLIKPNVDYLCSKDLFPFVNRCLNEYNKRAWIKAQDGVLIEFEVRDL